MRAHLVIDMQESFRRLPSWPRTSEPRIVEKVNELVAGARRRGDLVVWVLHADEEPGPFDPRSGFVRLLDGLDPHDGEPVLTKTAHNAFTTTGLHRLLTSRGVREVTVSGIRTEQCCETTARLASDLGFDVLFVSEATATHPLPGLTTAQIIERTEAVLAGRFADIVTIKGALS
ncbi:cysteine hydrolase family protein [Actinocorallia longicatena]|uniref:Cysteine hydrolase family protein n=1 Tax=Actinocorallia longicatena TaxID=111803 RepID=A0ABP6QBV2_9ACTN